MIFADNFGYLYMYVCLLASMFLYRIHMEFQNVLFTSLFTKFWIVFAEEKLFI